MNLAVRIYVEVQYSGNTNRFDYNSEESAQEGR